MSIFWTWWPQQWGVGLGLTLPTSSHKMQNIFSQFFLTISCQIVFLFLESIYLTCFFHFSTSQLVLELFQHSWLSILNFEKYFSITRTIFFSKQVWTIFETKYQCSFSFWPKITNTFVLLLEPLMRSPLTLWKGCENFINYGHSQYCEWP